MKDQNSAVQRIPQQRKPAHHKFVMMHDGSLMEMPNNVPTEEQMHAIDQARLKN